MSETILIVDDEVEIADLLELYLQNEGYQIYKFYNGEDALKCVRTQKVDLAVLDIMLPDIDGFILCKEIRKEFFFPIIMLTAKIEDRDKISGLMFGADDYITKPFNPLEIVARIKTQLRRYKLYNEKGINGEGQNESQNVYDIRGLWINQDTHTCTLYSRDLELTPIEFSILWYLCENQGKVISSEQIFETVWKEKYYDNNNTVMAHIGRIREKMRESYKNPKFIKTVWGVGYCIE